MEFRKLTDDEALRFRAWARKNYELYTDISGLWHPVVQHECVRMNSHAAKYVEGGNDANCEPSAAEVDARNR